jgi:hypothetical protein
LAAIKCSDFARHALKLPLWDKQADILDEFFHGGKTHAVWALGRRSGKTLMAAVACTYICFVLEEKYKRKIRKGESWYICTIANGIDQAKIALNTIRGLIVESPFAQEIVRETTDTLEISNGCVFRAISSSARASRGRAVAAIIMDELAFSQEGDANAGAKAIYDALSPSIAQFGNHGRILELSSPWLTDGLFYQHFCEATSGEFPFMQPVNTPTWEMNPELPYDCAFMQAERKRDPDKFMIEYGAQFARNMSALLASEVVEAAINKHRSLLPPSVHFHGKYVLALDPARGGVGRDDYTACIVHFDGETLVVDKFHTFLADFEINGKKEVSIQAVEDWIREHHKLYNFDSIVLDQYNSSATIQSLAADFPIEELTWSVSSKMKAFSKMKELFNAGLVDIYNHEKAIKQLKNLSVIYKASGQWSISGGKEVGVDDYAFAMAAAILQASKDDDLNWIDSLIR